MKVTEAIIQYLASNGVSHLFGVSGSASSAFLVSAKKNEMIKPVITKHESGAGWMAYGYGLTGKNFGACVTTMGSAAIHIMPAVAAAHAKSVPMLIITGQIETGKFGRGAFQETTGKTIRGGNIMKMMETITKLNIMLEDPDDLGDILQRIHNALTTGRRGPVHLNVPFDVQLSDVKAPVFVNEKVDVWPRRLNIQKIEQVSALLMQAKAPLIIFGSGCAQCREQAAQFAVRFDVPFCTTIQAKGLVSLDSEMDFLIAGMCGSVKAEKYIREDCDLILAIGTSFNEFTTYNFAPWLMEHKKLIQVDIDPREIGRNYRADIGLQMDASVFFAVLSEIVAGKEKHGFRESSIADKYRNIELKRPVEPAEKKKGRIHPMTATNIIEKNLPIQANIIGDGGNTILWFLHYMDISSEQTFYTDVSTGCLGSSIATAIGVKLAEPEKPAIALCGDGAFLMSGNEIATAAEYNIPVAWIVHNDSCFGMIEQGDLARYGTSVDCSFKFADIASIARAYGVDAIKIGHEKTLTAVLKKMDDMQRPLLIDLQVVEKCQLKLYDKVRSAKKEAVSV